MSLYDHTQFILARTGERKKYCFQCFVCYLPTIWADDEVAGKVFVLLNLGWQICDHSSPVKPSMQT